MINTIVKNPIDILALMHHCAFVKDGDVWYRDFKREIPLMELVRNLNKAYGDSEASAMNDEAFSDKMYDDLQFKPEEDCQQRSIQKYYRNVLILTERINKSTRRSKK